MFQKTADMPVEKVLCSCGAELQPGMEKCPKCGKELNVVKQDEAKTDYMVN